MLQSGHAANLAQEARQQLLIIIEGVGQDLERHHPPQEQMLRLEDDSHATGPESIKDSVVAEQQSARLAGADAARLVFREQFLLDEPAQQPLGLRQAAHLLADRFGLRFPILAQDHRAAQHVLEQELSWGGNSGGSLGHRGIPAVGGRGHCSAPRAEARAIEQGQPGSTHPLCAGERFGSRRECIRGETFSGQWGREESSAPDSA